MRAVILLSLVVAALACTISDVGRVRGADPEWAQFVTFTKQFGRTYPTIAEVNARFDTFKANLQKSRDLAARNPYATFGVNNFADVSAEEFARTHLMPVNLTTQWRLNHKMPKWKRPAHLADVTTRGVSDIDWCQEGYCSPVKDQGQCGSCWAFSATQVTESSIAIDNKMQNNVPVLAPEQVVDCDTSDGGCNGGDPRSALTYINGAGGQDSESSYPYTAGNTGSASSCNFQQANVDGDEGGPQDVSDGNEQSLIDFLETTGPPSVCVDASSWQSYTGGVLSSCGCNIDHAVQATGITTQFGGSGAYIIRNSWASSWGVNGFIYLAIGSNTCCVANEVSWTTSATPN